MGYDTIIPSRKEPPIFMDPAFNAHARPARPMLYYYDGTPHERRRLYRRLLALGLLLTVCAAASGFLPAPGALTAFYILVPYTIALGAGISLLYCLFRLWRGGSPLSEELYRATMEQFRPRGTLAAVCAVCALLGEGYYVLRHGAEGQTVWVAVFLLCQAVVLLCAILWIVLTENAPWTREEAPAAPTSTQP